MASKKNGKVQYNFLNDRPTSRDEIGTHSMVADSLLEIIHSNLKRPFVVGLFGAWGVGKSSIVEMLQGKTKEDGNRTKVVVVDAWRTHMETFLRQFVKKLARELLSKKQAKEVSKKTDIKEVLNRSRWEPGSRATNWFYIFVCVVVTLAGILLINYFMGVDSEFPADKIAILFLTALIAMYFQFILPKYSVRTDSSEENVTIHDVTHFRKIYFEDIIDRCNEETVCIVIDNLDRVGADDAVKIMRAIKTFIVDVEEIGPDEESKDALPHKMLDKVVFIIPCDDEALRKHILKRDSQESGNEFLRKFFNVSLSSTFAIF